jgi:chromatin remodeling complex protein RSC6
MVRVSKADKQTVRAPETVVVVASTTNAKAPRVKKTKEEVVAPVEVAPVVDTTSSSVPEVVEGADTSVCSKINEFSVKLHQMASLFATMKVEFKVLEKVVARELKNAQKSSSKHRKKNSGNRQPSGFVKPTRISDELAKFLGKQVGIEMARTEVSKEINAYIREKGLQDSANGRKIHPDGNLSKLLNLQKDDELTYFNLQKYMKHHFIKPTPAVITA